jgi:DNA-binding NarL/FixJ family response regulator
MGGASVLLVESNDILRKGLSCSLAASRCVGCVSEAENVSHALGIAERRKARVAVVGSSMLSEGGDLLRRLEECAPGIRTIVIAHDETSASLDLAVRSGAMALLGCGSTRLELREALECVLAGRRYVAPRLRESLIGSIVERRSSATTSLTKRERVVLQRIGEGDSNQEIAERLGVSRRTVDTHRTRLMRKLDIHKTAGLVRYAVREGLVEL